MRLRNFFGQGAVNLALSGTTREQVLPEMVALLGLGTADSGTLLRVLQRRESIGSTGVGRGIAIPHSRSPLVSELRLAYGRRLAGVDYQALDGKLVYHFFLIVAPPDERTNQYLPVLGRIAQLGKEPDICERLAALTSADEFFALLDEKGV
jgi:mannitol/fructose-specific phosphotransferase system IIA component (Ntr-type)